MKRLLIFAAPALIFLSGCGGDTPPPKTDAKDSVKAVSASAAGKLDPEAIIKKSDCLACHKVDAKLVGPSYKDVAKKYAGQEGAVELLVKKVKEGGTGVWGPVPMTPHPNLTDAEIKAVVEWVLKQ